MLLLKNRPLSPSFQRWNLPPWPNTWVLQPLSMSWCKRRSRRIQIAASFHGWQASRNVPKQVSALPETQLSVQQFSVGSPRPFAGYSNSDFAYIGFGASQDIPYPGKRQLHARVAEHEADSMGAQTDSVRRTVIGNLKTVYFQLAYIQQTLGVLLKS